MESYWSAIHDVDAKVGMVLAATRQRSTIAEEDWLVAVTTDHGGSEKGHGKNIPQQRTIFVILNGSTVANT